MHLPAFGIASVLDFSHVIHLKKKHDQLCVASGGISLWYPWKRFVFGCVPPVLGFRAVNVQTSNDFLLYYYYLLILIVIILLLFIATSVL